MKVVILCGGSGTRLREETESKPKPMVEIGGRPIVWHIMKTFAHHGYKDFILCLGYKGEVIKDYFLSYQAMHSDLSVELDTGDVRLHDPADSLDWRVTLADTGLQTMTGARVKRVEKYVDGDTFMLTYADAVTDLNIGKLVDFHDSKNNIGTVTAISPASSYGELRVEGERVVGFREKPDTREALISGGYFVFDRAFFKYLSDDESCVLEREPLERLVEDGQLGVYTYTGYWQCMDTYREMQELNEQWNSGHPKWRVWE